MENAKIEKLLEHGCKRWSKNGYDRLYIPAAVYGLEQTFYKHSGLPCRSWVRGELIPNSRAVEMTARGTQVYIDLKKDDTLHIWGPGMRRTTIPMIEDAVEALLRDIDDEMRR